MTAPVPHVPEPGDIYRCAVFDTCDCELLALVLRRNERGTFDVEYLLGEPSDVSCPMREDHVRSLVRYARAAGTVDLATFEQFFAGRAGN